MVNLSTQYGGCEWIMKTKYVPVLEALNLPCIKAF